jgi:hypothetical protein
MLAPVAEYAARRLAASDELALASLAHAQNYLALVSGGTPQTSPSSSTRDKGSNEGSRTDGTADDYSPYASTAYKGLVGDG